MFTFYITHTLRFSISFSKDKIYFNKKQKLFHHIMVWIVPFIWIILIKTLMKPTLGAHHYKNISNEWDTNYDTETWG